MRNKFIAGNWKMNGNLGETRELISQLKQKVAGIQKTTIMVAPPFTSLGIAAELLRNTNIALGGQNIYWEDKGAFTGEVSPVMLKEAGCRYVIIGHSERRQYFKESDQDVNRKIAAALKHQLLPIVCIGETLEQREAATTLAIVGHQLRTALEGFSADDVGSFTIAYEPVWAIGTGRAAGVKDAVEVHAFIRSVLTEVFGGACAQKARIQYGGSVNESNIDSYIKEPEIDGALVGGASLKADSFTKIIQAAENAS